MHATASVKSSSAGPGPTAFEKNAAIDVLLRPPYCGLTSFCIVLFAVVIFVLIWPPKILNTAMPVSATSTRMMMYSTELTPLSLRRTSERDICDPPVWLRERKPRQKPDVVVIAHEVRAQRGHRHRRAQNHE